MTFARTGIRDLADVPRHLLNEIGHFFDIYKELEPGKSTDVRGWMDRAEAERVIKEAEARVGLVASGCLSAIEIPEGSLFGLDNLPYGVFAVGGAAPRAGVRVAESVIDLAVALRDEVFAAPTLNAFMAEGPARWAAARRQDHRADHLRGRAGRCDLPAARGATAAAVRGRRLRGLLRLRAPRVQHRPALPARRRAADAQLEAPPRRLPRQGRHGRRLGHRHHPPVRPAQGAQ